MLNSTLTAKILQLVYFKHGCTYYFR